MFVLDTHIGKTMQLLSINTGNGTCERVHSLTQEVSDRVHSYEASTTTVSPSLSSIRMRLAIIC